MPATSKSQQRLFGWALACKRGETDNCPTKIKKLAARVSEEDLEAYASTSHEDLPSHVKEAFNSTILEFSREELQLLESDAPGGEYSTVKNTAGMGDVIPPPPPGVKGEGSGDEFPSLFKPSILKLPMQKAETTKRRVMDYDGFLKAINYKTHDGITQNGHGQNLTGKNDGN